MRMSPHSVSLCHSCAPFQKSQPREIHSLDASEVSGGSIRRMRAVLYALSVALAF